MKSDLLNYLENIIALEKTKYFQEKTIATIDANLSKLGIPSKITRRNTVVLTKGVLSNSSGTGFIIGAAAALIIGSNNLFVAMIEFGLYGLLCGFIFGLFLLYSKKREEKAQKSLSEQEYNRAKAADQRRICAEKNQAEQLIIVKKEMWEKQKHTEALLRKYYEIGILYPTYQNITAVCSIYDYLKSGKCSQLHGHEGAYILYDQERRLDRIIEGIDRISTQLEQIRQNQVMLHAVANEINSKLSHIAHEMDEQVKLLQFDAKQNSIIAYYSAISAQELHMSNWLNSYALDKCGILPLAQGTSHKYQ